MSASANLRDVAATLVESIFRQVEADRRCLNKENLTAIIERELMIWETARRLEASRSDTLSDQDRRIINQHRRIIDTAVGFVKAFANNGDRLSAFNPVTVAFYLSLYRAILDAGKL